MKIGIYYLDALDNDSHYIQEAKNVIKQIQKSFDRPFIEVDHATWSETDANFIYICSGDASVAFIQLYNTLPGPYYLVASDNYNSLAAALEILTFINAHDDYVTMIHGTIENITERIKSYSIHNHAYKKIQDSRLGVIGLANPNLIASERSDENAIQCTKMYENYVEQLGVSFVNISDDELLSCYQECQDSVTNQFTKEIYKSRFSVTKINEALRVYQALKKLIDKYQLDGLTISSQCLIHEHQTTACLALAMLNSEGITSSSDGDLSSLITMLIIRKLLKLPSFQANVCRIDPNTNRIIMANCTVPFEMISRFSLTNHFMSKKGVAIKGDLPIGKATIFKVSRDLGTYFVKNAYLNMNLNDEKMSRTQVELQITTYDVEYFFNRPLGNYHIVILGHHQKTIEKFMQRIFKSKSLVKKIVT